MKSKRAAMEMSVGTIVTIVLLMAVLVLGIFLVQRIFSTGTNAIDTIDSEVQSQIEKLFADEGRKIAVYPTSRDIKIKKGDDPKGFAFSIRNDDVVSANFAYSTTAEDVSDCQGSITVERANSYLVAQGSGSFSLGPGNTLDLPEIVKFSIPESAPPCTILYRLSVSKDGTPYTGSQVFVTIK